MNHIDVMKQALDALRNLLADVELAQRGSMHAVALETYMPEASEAIEALRAAIAQPESEPVSISGYRLVPGSMVLCSFAAPVGYVPLSDDQVRDLAKDCGLDWQRGYMPLFDGDLTNRYAVFAEAIERSVRGAP